MSVNVTRLVGWQGVQKDLAQLPYLIDQKKFFIAAFRKVGNKVKNVAKANVNDDTGLLKKHIKVFVTKQGRTQGYVTIGVKFKPKDKWSGGPSYASKVEYGTSQSAAQPYMRPAFDQTKGIVQTEMIGACKQIVGKAIKGLNKGKRYYQWKI
jgi:HK97 gp10 family phage protein